MLSNSDPDNAPKKDKKAISPDERRMHVQLALLALAVMIDVLGFSVIIPLVPAFIQRGMHLPLTQLAAQDRRIGEYGGWLTAVYALMQFLFAPFWGQLSDKIGRKPILIGSLLGDAVFYTLFGLSTHSLAGQFAARILAGIFSSASLAVAQAYAADITPPHLRAMGLGYLGAAFGVGFILGPALGGLLGQFGLAWPLYFAAALALVNAAYIYRTLPEPQRPPQAAPPLPSGFTARLGQMAQAVRGPLGFLYLLTFAVTFAFGNLEGTFTAYLEQHFHFANSVGVAGGVFAYVGVLIVIIQGGMIRPLVKKYGEPALVVVGIGLMAVGFLLFPLAPVLSVLLIGPMVPIAVGSGLNSPSLRALVSRRATAQGAALGLSASFDSLARATGPATAGYLYKHVGQTAPYWCAGVVMSLCFLFALARRKDMTAPVTALLLVLLLTVSAPAHAQNSPVPAPQYGAWRSCRIGGGGYAQNVVLCPSDPKRGYAYIDVGVAANTAAQVASFSLAAAAGRERDVYVYARFTWDDGGASADTAFADNLLLLAEPKDLRLPDAGLPVTISDAGAYEYSVTVTARRFAPFLWLRRSDHKPLAGLSDNFFSLKPGETQTLTVAKDDTLRTVDDLRGRLFLRSL